MPTKQGPSPKLKRAGKKHRVVDPANFKPVSRSKRRSAPAVPLAATDSSVGSMQRHDRMRFEARQKKSNWNKGFFTAQATLAAEHELVLSLTGTAMEAAARFITRYATTVVPKTDERGREQKRCSVIADAVRNSYPPIQRRTEMAAINKGIRAAVDAITESYEGARRLVATS